MRAYGPSTDVRALVSRLVLALSDVQNEAQPMIDSPLGITTNELWTLAMHLRLAASAAEQLRSLNNTGDGSTFVTVTLPVPESVHAIRQIKRATHPGCLESARYLADEINRHIPFSERA
jgi:hypothetical protein